MEFKTNYIDDNRFELTIKLSKDDFINEVDKQLKKKRNETVFKGFRKGKTPMGFLRRTFGNQILADVINKKIDEALSKYLKDEGIELMLSPIAVENQKPLDININKVDDIEVSFDLHKKPDYEIKGISEEDSYTSYDIEIDQKIIDEQLDRFKNQYGKYEPYDGDFDEDTFITVKADELDGDNIKKDGYNTEFSIKIAELSDEYKDSVLKLKKDSEFTFDVYKLLADADDKKVRDYLLNIDENDFEEGEDIGIGNMFKGKIIASEKFVPAELTPEFFEEQNFPNIKSEEDYIKLITDDFKKHYDSESEKFLQLEIAEKLKEINELPVNKEYVKRWIKEQYPDKTEEEVDNSMDDVYKDLNWQSIVDKLIKKYDVEVTKEELSRKLESQARQMVGGNQELLSQIMEYMIQDEKLVNNTYNEMFIDKIFGEVAKTVTKVSEKITWDDFLKLVQKYNKQKVEETQSQEEE